MPRNLEPCDEWDQVYAKDLATWDSGRVESSLVRVVADYVSRPGSCLDLGCGSGTDLCFFAERGWQVTGVEIASLAARQARSRLSQRGLNGHVVNGDILQVELQQHAFDLVLDKACFHFLRPRQHSAYLSRLLSWLKDDGLFVLYTASWLDDVIGPQRFTIRDVLEIFGETLKVETVSVVRWESHRYRPQPILAVFRKVERVDATSLPSAR